MHFHCEIVIPPTADIEAAITSVMKQFDENGSEDNEDIDRRSVFWDFWSIGGRWSGHKLLAKYDQAKLDAFYEWLKEEKITCAGIQCGKQEIRPASQIPKVDAKWNEMFPSSEFLPCPLFRHSNDQYAKGLAGTLPHDVSRFEDVPRALTCSRVIFAKPSFEMETKSYTGPLEAGFMLTDTAWNGCNHMRVDWNGTFESAVEAYQQSLRNHKEDYVSRVQPQSDWLVVTVDYHS